MNNHIITNKLLVLFLLLFMAACNKDEAPFEEPGESNKYLSGIIAEKHIDKTEIASQVADFASSQGINIPEELLSSLICSIDVAAIEYNTTGVDGKQVTASGVIAIPEGTISYEHLLSIQHGTLDMEEAPSNQLFYYEMMPVVSGHIVVMADYLGYGSSQTSDRQHPYLHNKLTGTACADMIEAAREYLKYKSITENDDDIELLGYSQGGQATIATLLELEERGQAESIRGVYAGGGVYDLINTLEVFTSPTIGPMSYMHTGYAPYLIRGMVYGEQLTVSDENLYAPEVIDEGLNKMFSTRPLSEWHNALGNDITKVLNHDFFAAPDYNNNKDVQAVIEALRKNSLVNTSFQPQTPIMLYHSPKDDFVPYSNAVNAHNLWQSSTLVDLSMPSHVLGGVEFMLRYMGLWELIGPIIQGNM